MDETFAHVLFELFDGEVRTPLQALDTFAGCPEQLERKVAALKAVHLMLTQAMAAEPLVASWLIASSQAIVARLLATGATLPQSWVIMKFDLTGAAWPHGLVITL